MSAIHISIMFNVGKNYWRFLGIMPPSIPVQVRSQPIWYYYNGSIVEHRNCSSFFKTKTIVSTNAFVSIFFLQSFAVSCRYMLPRNVLTIVTLCSIGSVQLHETFPSYKSELGANCQPRSAMSYAGDILASRASHSTGSRASSHLPLMRVYA